MSANSAKILITGGAGFIGSEFVRQAAQRGRHIVVVDKITYAGDLARLKSVKGKFTFYKADIARQDAIAAIMKKERPDVVVHGAAESHVDRSIDDASAFVLSNVLGTQNCLAVSHAVGIKKFIHISTDEVYGEITKGAFKEDVILNPSSPYSATKASADLLVRAYMRTFKFPAVIVRPSNNYGPWQYPEKLIPLVIYKALKGQKIPVYAKGLNTREWLHVSDCARGIGAALNKGKVGEVYNLGSGMEQRNIDLIKTILKMLNVSREMISFVKDRPGHDLRYALDSAKIRKELSWRPQVDLNQGLLDTVQWYQDNFDWLTKKFK